MLLWHATRHKASVAVQKKWSNISARHAPVASLGWSTNMLSKIIGLRAMDLNHQEVTFELPELPEHWDTVLSNYMQELEEKTFSFGMFEKNTCSFDGNSGTQQALRRIAYGG